MSDFPSGSFSAGLFPTGQDPNVEPFNPNALYVSGPDDSGLAVASPQWYEVSCVRAGAPNLESHDAVRALAFDPCKELVWAGTASGMLHAHHADDMTRIVSTYVTEPSAHISILEDVRDVVVSHTAVLTAVGYGLAVVSRGGVIRSTVRADAINNAKALALNPLTDNHVCIGGESPMLAVVDVDAGRIVRQAGLRGATGVTAACWAAPNSASNLAIFSTATGRISFCDPSTMREVNAIAAFTGAATAITTTGYNLAATGLASHAGVSYLEPQVKMFDIRAVDTPLPSVMFPAPPISLTFDPYGAAACGAEVALWVLAPNGLLQLLDVSAIGVGQPPFPLCDQIHLDAGTDMLTTMAASPEGLLVIGDSGGFVHQWTSSDSAKVNADSEPLWTHPVPVHPPTPSIRLDDLMASEIGASIPKCAISEYDNGFLTDELFEHPSDTGSSRGAAQLHALRGVSDPNTHSLFYPRKPFGRFPPVISDDILNRVQHGQSTVKYAQAPAGFVRNSQSGHKKTPVVRGADHDHDRTWSLKMRSERNSILDGSGAVRRKARKLDLSKPAARSSYVEMDLVAWESIEGFDFLQYNKSGQFCGLENALPNVYVNAVVQMLYFTPPVRKAVGDHVCDRDWCISCELGFLFHMFDLGGAGMACEAGNFTRAFMTMANAGALGLLDGPHALPLAQRIENFSRYLLEQLHKDEQSEESGVSLIFGAEALSYGTFLQSGSKWERKSRTFQHTLTYESGKGRGKAEGFCELLERSLWQSLDPTRAFCEPSQQFEMMTHRRELRSLPNVLLLGCNTKARGYLEWWLGDEGAFLEKNSSSLHLGLTGGYGLSLDEIATRGMEKEKKLLESIHVDVRDGISVSPTDASDGVYGYDVVFEHGRNREYELGDDRAIYDLSFVVMHVAPNVNNNSETDATRNARNSGGHLVSYIRVPNSYRKQGRKEEEEKTIDNGTEHNWWCFNDFVIAKCCGFEEVSAVDIRWKMPCLLGYVRRDVRARVDAERWESCHKKVSVRDIIGVENQNAAIGLQPDEEAPGKGTVLALDCEFVMVSREEADIFGDGSREVVVPARMALARVSVIRGYGRLHGRALIDDYVAVRENVVDYLTRFSGLVEGDLQVGRSRYTVSSLKSVYKRLRCLVDAGCVFVGHGLKSDFRIINFVVPSEQVIDTVTMFRQGQRRLLGLRFLSHALLGEDIQSETHDSIEDANAALRLYELYIRMGKGDSGGGRIARVLKELYSYGYAHNWKVDEDEPFVVSDWSIKKS